MLKWLDSEDFSITGDAAQRPSGFLGYIHCFFIVHLPPINMVHIEKIFSESVLAETFPKPTLVKLLRAKYSEVT